MLKKSVEFALSLLLMANLALTGHAVAQSSSQSPDKQNAKVRKIKKRILDLGVNKEVSGKLVSGEKITQGRILEISDQSVKIRFLDAQSRITSRDLAYDEIKELRANDRATSAAKKTLLFGGAAFLAAMITLGAMAAAGAR